MLRKRCGRLDATPWYTVAVGHLFLVASAKASFSSIAKKSESDDKCLIISSVNTPVPGPSSTTVLASAVLALALFTSDIAAVRTTCLARALDDGAIAPVAWGCKANCLANDGCRLQRDAVAALKQRWGESPSRCD